MKKTAPILIVSIALLTGVCVWQCRKPNHEDRLPVIHFWGLGALVVGPERGEVLLVRMPESSTHEHGYHEHFARLVLPRKALVWVDPKKDTARKDLDYLIPIGESETYAIWNLKVGDQISIKGDPPNGVRFASGKKDPDQVVPKETDKSEIGWLGSPKCVNKETQQISNGCATIRADIWNDESSKNPQIAARFKLTQGTVDAIIADTERVWGFDFAEKPAAKKLKDIGGQQALASIVRFTHNPTTDKYLTICVGKCGSPSSEIDWDTTKGALTVVNYPVWDGLYAGLYDGDPEKPPDPDKALSHFAAYYDLVANSPDPKHRPVPYRLTTGIPLFAKTNQFLREQGRIPQNPPNCAMARLDEPMPTQAPTR